MLDGLCSVGWEEGLRDSGPVGRSSGRQTGISQLGAISASRSVELGCGVSQEWQRQLVSIEAPVSFAVLVFPFVHLLLCHDTDVYELGT